MASAVAELVDPVKQVLALSQNALRAQRLVGLLLIMCVLGLGFALWRQEKLLDHFQSNGHAQAETTRQLQSIVGKLDTAATELREVKDDVEDIPRIDVRPADTADPTSKPVAVITPGKTKAPKGKPSTSKASPPKPAAIEIPLDLPPKGEKR